MYKITGVFFIICTVSLIACIIANCIADRKYLKLTDSMESSKRDSVAYRRLRNKRDFWDNLQMQVYKPIILLGILVVVSGVITYFSFLYVPYSEPSSAYDTCSICGGEIKCGICGEEDALYCENASYGKGTAHYCQKHWADCVKWHENK